MFFKKSTYLILAVLSLNACKEEIPLETTFDIAVPILTEPDTAYCSYDEFMEIEEGELGAIKFRSYSSDRTNINFYFDKSTDKVSLYYNGSPQGFSGIVNDTFIDVQESQNLTVHFQYGNYGNEKQHAREGKVYFKVLPSMQLQITWCNLLIPKYQGHMLKSGGGFVY
ncbi:MAG: hypothetical protein HKP14_05755 [Bacteroidia bacterium]|nr:hypothetical protein [Bacteroidia bacterium]